MYCYYPSCNFKRLFPETAKRIADYLAAQPDVKVAGCCHATHDLPEAGDTVVTICTSCMRLFDETRPDVPNIDLFTFLLGCGDFPWPDRTGETACLQDCFRARGKSALQDSVRECLDRMNVQYTEIEPSRDDADYDGPFLLREVPQRNIKEAPKYFGEYVPKHLHVLPKEEWSPVFKRQADKAEGRTVVVYCNTCHMGLQEGGADVRHLAELLFP